MAAAAALAVSAVQATAQELIDKGFYHGWNLLVDPSFGNGCLIQTVYEDLSLVRLGYDALNQQGYFTVYNKAWGEVKKGERYNIRFDLDGQSFDAVATGVQTGKAHGAIVFFKDREFIHAIAQKKVMTVFGQTGQRVMAIDLAGTAKALEYARSCQEEQGWGG
ncbi:MAG: hypothetical protein GJ676_20170 [Rhodobacteraceae bacterium]|nr:hypothetical protein [Paracoccaceae bacterium]